MEMGNLLRQQGKLDEALVYLDQAAAMLAGLDHPDEAVIEEARGLVHEMKGDTVRARAAYERALVIREAAVGRDHEFTAYTLLRLTSVADDPDQSLAYALEARAILKRTLGPESAVVAATHAAAAEINMNRGRFDEALADAERAVELYSKSERLPDELARAKLLLADLLWRDPQARVRAHGLAEEAEAFLAASWAGNAPYLEAARAWLREHPTPR
jgi:tetratricopeptide (TPR) repeat protein